MWELHLHVGQYKRMTTTTTQFNFLLIHDPWAKKFYELDPYRLNPYGLPSFVYPQLSFNGGLFCYHVCDYNSAMEKAYHLLIISNSQSLFFVQYPSSNHIRGHSTTAFHQLYLLEHNTLLLHSITHTIVHFLLSTVKITAIIMQISKPTYLKLITQGIST